MPLSNELRLINMEVKCLKCGLDLVTNGNWFRTAAGFN